MRRLLTIALAMGLLTTIPLAPGTSLAEAPAAKFDDALARALAGDPAWARWADKEGRFEVLVAGAEHRVPEAMPASRDGWNQYWAQEALPFVMAVRAALQPGDVWVSYLPIIPQVKLKLTPARVADLAKLAEVQALALDWPEATYVLDDGPGAQMGTSVPMTGAPDLHKLGFHGEGVKLAVIDTGMEFNHPMFLDEMGNKRITKWFDATSAGCANPCDTHGHGTHTASTAAGSNLAGGRYQGVAPRAELYGVKIFIGGSGTWEDAQEGLQASFDIGSELTSNSWGGGCGGPNDGGSLTERVAKNTALAGLQHIFSAGNSGTGSQATLCPARNDHVISVGAVDKNKVIAGFSSGGLCPDANGQNTRICPDVVAVGVNVDAAWLNGGYNTISGTSMAAPHVAGGAALMYQMAKALKDKKYNVPGQELELFFESKAQDLGTPGNDQRYGHGFIQLKPMGDDLLAGAQARATIDVSVSKAEMRARDTNTATIVVSNVGGKAITGTVRLTGGGELEHDGHVFLTQAVSLAAGASTTLTASIAGANLDPTKYHVVAALSYTYTSDGGSSVGTTISDFTSFILRGVKMSVSRTLAPSTATGAQQSVGLTLRNVGNEPATNVNLREGVPLLGYVIQPQAKASATDAPYNQLSAPPPSSAGVDVENRTLTMFYTPSSVPASGTYQVSYRLASAAPGTYDFRALVDFTDAIGDSFQQSLTQSQSVTCPKVTLPTLLRGLPPPPTLPQAC